MTGSGEPRCPSPFPMQALHGAGPSAKRPWGRDSQALLDETAAAPQPGPADVGSLLFALRAADDLCVRKVRSHQPRRRRSRPRRGVAVPTSARASDAPADVSALKSRIQQLRSRRDHEGRQVKEAIASNEKLLAAIHAKSRSLKAHNQEAEVAGERTARFNLRRELQLLKRRVRSAAPLAPGWPPLTCAAARPASQELLALHTLKSIEAEQAQAHTLGMGSPLLALFANEAGVEQPGAGVSSPPPLRGCGRAVTLAQAPRSAGGGRPREPC